MTLRILLFSSEDEDFALEFKIDADASFANLHRLILNSCNYKEMQGQRFFICDENWKPRTRILLSDEENVNIDEDVLLMEDTDLGDFLEDEGQLLTYRFDPENRRMFLMKLAETSFGSPVSEKGELCRHRGTAPLQIAETKDVTPIVKTEMTQELDEEFYGEDGFNEEDMDK